MKQIIFSILILFVCSLSAQEVISETTQYVTYQDTLFTLKTTRIVGTGYEGLNDTTVTYSTPTDTAGVVSQLYTAYLNESNTATAKMRNAAPFRSILAVYLSSKALLATIGRDLDAENVNRFINAYEGLWRVFNTDGSDFLVNVARHPTQTGILRATGTNGEGFFNILIYNRTFFRFTVGAGNLQYLMFNGNSETMPVYQNPVAITTPTAILASSSFRMVKQQR